MRAIAGQRAGRGVKRGERATDGSIVFQSVETGIHREGQPTRVFEAVAELHAFGVERAEIAKSCTLVDAAQAHPTAFATDKPAVRKIVAPIGKAAAPGVTAVKACKVAVSVRALAGRQIVTEAEGPAFSPIWHRGGLGMGRSPAQTERSQYESET